MSGLSVVGRDLWGVFPLRGKLLNVRDASVSSITANAEITNIKQILGLRNGVKYQDTTSLRYGSVMIMSDQDVDGSHIAGLVLNFFHAQYPSLLEIPGFLKRFVTPIVVAKKGTKMVEFYSIPDFEEWKVATPDVSTWKTKYYKGLGTSDANDAKRYFNNLKALVKTLTWSDNAAESIDKSFNKSRADERKTWLLDFKPGNQLDQKIKLELLRNTMRLIHLQAYHKKKFKQEQQLARQQRMQQVQTPFPFHLPGPFRPSHTAIPLNSFTNRRCTTSLAA
jgi:DNA topoisomerase-2